MGVTPETAERLCSHAGLVTSEHETSVDALLFGSEPIQGQFEAAMTDLLQTLQTVNLELNGEVPSESIGDSGDDAIPRSVAYAISEIGDRLRRKDRDEVAEMVDIAWNGVLAGDIDDVAGHVRDEIHARHG